MPQVPPGGASDEGNWLALRAAAKEASTNAYCPYSDFAVGASVLAASGQIYSGCNVENMSFPVGLCAERSAISAMVSAGERGFLMLAVYTPTTDPVTPCGMCRQFMAEFSPEAQVTCFCDGPSVFKTTVRDLLPAAFQSPELKQ